MASEPRHIKNPYPAYTPEICRTVVLNGKLLRPLQEKVDNLIDRLYYTLSDVIPAYGPSSDSSIYTGYCGIAMVNYLFFKKTRDKKYLSVVKDLVGKALNTLKGRRISFLNGDAGPIALGAVLGIIDGNNHIAELLINRLIKLGDVDDTHIPNELLYGRAGYIYALLFIDQEITPMIPEAILRKHVEKILYSGARLARRKQSTVPLEFEWHEKGYLGAAHGYAGILYILLVAARFLTEYELETLIRPTIEWLISLRFSSDNFPSSSEGTTDRLVQWCHGAPGFVLLLCLASEVYNCSRYLDVALRCGDVVWERGLLKKGYSICHGVAGNAYTFLHLYQVTTNNLHLYRAACFADWCTRFPENEGMRPDHPYSLFEGKAGLLYFLTDIKEPNAAAFPCFELKSLIEHRST